MRRSIRAALAGLGAVVGAVVLSGCVTAQVVSQDAPLSTVTVDTSFQTNRQATDKTVQLLLGYLVPTNVSGPATIDDVNAVFALTASTQYAAELQKTQAAPAGSKWLAYISQQQFLPACPANTTCPAVTFRLQPKFNLLPAADGSPYVTPFNVTTQEGFRDVVTGSLPGTRPVNCAEGASTTCATSTGTNNGTVNLTTGATTFPGAPVPTKDFGIVATGATASVLPGQTASLTFTTKYSGAAPGPAFVFSTSTTLGGATASANVINYTPAADQTAPVTVTVPVPSGAAPGTYDVVLKATTGAQVRQGVGKLTVTAPPVVATPPPVTIVNNPVKVVKAPKRLNAKVRFRIAVGKNLQFLRLNVVGAPTKARINVKCVKGCSLNKASLASGKTVNLSALFKGKALKPGVKLEIRVTKKGFLGQFFRYTFTSAGVKGTECTISLKGKIGSCTPA